MTLQTSGTPLQFSQINAELMQANNAQVSLGDDRLRSMATTYTGAISASSLYGKDYYSAHAHKLTGLNPDISEFYTYTDGPVSDSLGFLYYFAYAQYLTHIVKTDTLGNIIWQKKFTTDGGNSIAISLSDELYVSTNYTNLIKLDTSGNIIWQKNFAEITNDTIQHLTVDGSGNIYFLTNSTVNIYNYRGIWIYKLDSSGTVSWTRKVEWPDTSDGLSYPSMSVSKTGDVVVACCSVYNYYIYLIKYDSSGTLQWSRVTTGTSGSIFPTGIRQDSNSNIFIVGTDGNLPFLTKLNSAGTTQWTRKLASSTPTGFNGGYGGFIPVVVDPSDNVYFITQVGVKSDNTQFSYSVFKYNNSGTLQYYNRITLDTDAPSYNFYYINPGAFGPRMRISRDGNQLDLMVVTYRNGSAYNCVELRIPANGTLIPSKTMSWGGNTAVVTGTGFTESAGTTYTWSSNTGLATSTFTANTSATPTNTLSTSSLVIRLNGLN